MPACAKNALRGMHSWGPAAVAVSIIPFLPLVDPPVEWFLDRAFQHKVRVIHRRLQPYFSRMYLGVNAVPCSLLPLCSPPHPRMTTRGPRPDMVSDPAWCPPQHGLRIDISVPARIHATARARPPAHQTCRPFGAATSETTGPNFRPYMRRSVHRTLRPPSVFLVLSALGIGIGYSYHWRAGGISGAMRAQLPHSLENAEIAMRNHDRIMHPKRGKGVVVAVSAHRRNTQRAV